MKKKILEKIKKALPLVLCVLLSAVMILGCVLVGRSYGAFNTLSAGAESSFNPEDYPSANLLDMEDFNLSFSGTYKNTYTGYKLTPSTTYTLSFDYTLYECDRNGTQVRMFSCVGWSSSATAFSTNYSGTYKPYPTVDNVIYGTTYRRTITFTTTSATTQYLAARFVFVEGGSASINVDIEKIQLNIGSTAYPYVPSHNVLYENGYNKGLDTAKYGVFTDISVDLEGTFDGQARYFTDIPLTLSMGKLSFIEFYKQLSSSYTTGTDLRLYIDFNTPVLMERLKLKFYGNSSIYPLSSNSSLNTWKFYFYRDLTTSIHSSVFILNDLGHYENAFLTNNMNSGNSRKLALYCISDIYIPSLTYLADFFIVDDMDKGYELGYRDGLANGDSYDKGYVDGEDKGYKDGYRDGFDKGQSGDPWDLGAFIFAIVDAPFKVIREALNFEILGYDVSSVVLFVITAFIVVFVIKKLNGG